MLIYSFKKIFLHSLLSKVIVAVCWVCVPVKKTWGKKKRKCGCTSQFQCMCEHTCVCACMCVSTCVYTAASHHYRNRCLSLRENRATFHLCLGDVRDKEGGETSVVTLPVLRSQELPLCSLETIALPLPPPGPCPTAHSEP